MLCSNSDMSMAYRSLPNNYILEERGTNLPINTRSSAFMAKALDRNLFVVGNHFIMTKRFFNLLRTDEKCKYDYTSAESIIRYNAMTIRRIIHSTNESAPSDHLTRSWTRLVPKPSKALCRNCTEPTGLQVRTSSAPYPQ